LRNAVQQEPDTSSHYAGVRCVAWRHEPHGHTLQGFADLAWSGIIFHDVSVHARLQDHDQGIEVWLSFPVRRRGKDGQPIRLIHFERGELYDAFQTQAVAAVLAFPGVDESLREFGTRGVMLTGGSR
jgi:hypothetical protein